MSTGRQNKQEATTLVASVVHVSSIVAFSVASAVGLAVTKWNEKNKKNQNRIEQVHHRPWFDDDDGKERRRNVPFHSGQQQLSNLPTNGNGDDNKDPHSSLHAPYYHERLSMNEITQRSSDFLHLMKQRRSIRFFDPSIAIPQQVMINIIQTACTSPSGAHKQPWHFCLVGDSSKKQQIRTYVEQEEKINYERRMRSTWINDVSHLVANVGDTKLLKTNNHGDGNDDDNHDDNNSKKDIIIQKPYLTDAPWLIIVMKQPHGGIDPISGKRIDHYYVSESVGIACGMLIAAIHNANLVTLPSTPMGAEKNIKTLLKRPEHEKVMLLLPVGFPSKTATVPYRSPDQPRKPLQDVMSIHC